MNIDIWYINSYNHIDIFLSICLASIALHWFNSNRHDSTITNFWHLGSRLSSRLISWSACIVWKERESRRYKVKWDIHPWFTNSFPPKHQPYVPLPFSAHSNVSTSLLPFCHSAIRPVAPSLLHSCLLWAAQALFPGNATPKSPKVQQLHLSRSAGKTLIEDLYELLWSPMKSYEVCVTGDLCFQLPSRAWVASASRSRAKRASASARSASASASSDSASRISEGKGTFRMFRETSCYIRVQKRTPNIVESVGTNQNEYFANLCNVLSLSIPIMLFWLY